MLGFEEIKRNGLLGAIGPSGVKANINGPSIQIKQTKGPVGGFGYDRLLNKNLSVGGQLLFNGTGLLGIGIDF